MEEITNITTEAIDSYFDNLKSFGYVNYGDAYKVLLLSFIEELLTDPFAYYIDECDYKIIVDAIYCLAGTNCLIEHPKFQVSDALIHKTSKPSLLRLTEDCNLRNTLSILRSKD